MMLLWLACVTDPVASLDGDPEAGAQAYQADCALCHGLEGEGTSRGDALDGLFDRSTDTEVLDVVRFGRGDMQAFAYTDQELADLLAWMRQTF